MVLATHLFSCGHFHPKALYHHVVIRKPHHPIIALHIMTNLYGKPPNGGFCSLHLTGHEAPYLQTVSAGLMTGKRRPFVLYLPSQPLKNVNTVSERGLLHRRRILWLNVSIRAGIQGR